MIFREANNVLILVARSYSGRSQKGRRGIPRVQPAGAEAPRKPRGSPAEAPFEQPQNFHASRGCLGGLPPGRTKSRILVARSLQNGHRYLLH